MYFQGDFIPDAAFGKTLHCLAKIGDELYVDALPNGVSLHGVLYMIVCCDDALSLSVGTEDGEQR